MTIIKKTITYFLGAAAVSIFIYLTYHGRNFEIIDNIINFLQEKDPTFFNIIILVLISTLLITIGIPRLWVSAAIGASFGVIMGSILATLVSVIASTILYVTGKFLLQRLIKERFENRYAKIKDAIYNNAFFATIYFRFFPFTNSTLTSLFLGGINTPFLKFLFGSLIGFIPLTVIYVLIGNGSAEFSIMKVVVGFTGILFFALLQFLLSKYKKNSY